MRNVQRYFIFRASSFAKFVCRSRKWQPRRCASQIYISKHPERHKRIGEVFWKKEKRERKKENRRIATRRIPSLVIIKNKKKYFFLIIQSKTSTTSFCVLQSKALCEGKTMIETYEKLLLEIFGRIQWAPICNIKKLIQLNVRMLIFICKSVLRDKNKSMDRD